MLRTTPRLLVVVAAACAAAVIAIGISPDTVSAHNSLLSTDPADGAVVMSAPVEISWMFDKSVPLESMTVTLIDASGSRRELAGSVHSATGDTEVVTPLPALAPGQVSVRWRLVGPDGHPITGRIDFTVAPEPTPESPVGSTVAPVDSAVVDGPTDEPDIAAFSMAAPVRWALRYASYLAIMAVVGILLTSATVWSGAGDHPAIRRILEYSLFATAVLGFAQLMVTASDVGATAPWSSFTSVDAATSTTAGMAFAIRIVLAFALWLILFRAEITHRDIYWTAVSIPGLGLLATWAFAGHARSMRWPVIGVVSDVAHHAAAAAWIGGLAIVGRLALRTLRHADLTPVVRRFSSVAASSVVVLVVTGLVQTARLVGSPLDLFDASHGRYLAAKLLVLGLMLALANVNRRRLRRLVDDAVALGRQIGSLRRAIAAEFAIGLVIIGVTAAMVVTPPSSVSTETGAPPYDRVNALPTVDATPERPSP